MEDLMKKVLYTGVGLVAATTEKVQQVVNDLVDKDKLNQEEGKKIVDEFMKSTENRKEEFEAKLKDTVELIVKRLPVVKMDDFTALSKRVEELESQLTKAQSKGKATVKKVTSKAKATTDTTKKKVTNVTKSAKELVGA